MNQNTRSPNCTFLIKYHIALKYLKNAPLLLADTNNVHSRWMLINTYSKSLFDLEVYTH